MMLVCVRSGFGRETEAPVMYIWPSWTENNTELHQQTVLVSSEILHYAKFLIIRYVDGNII